MTWNCVYVFAQIAWRKPLKTFVYVLKYICTFCYWIFCRFITCTLFNFSLWIQLILLDLSNVNDFSWPVCLFPRLMFRWTICSHSCNIVIVISQYWLWLYLLPWFRKLLKYSKCKWLIPFLKCVLLCSYIIFCFK